MLNYFYSIFKIQVMKISLLILSILLTSLSNTIKCQSTVFAKVKPKAGNRNYFIYRPAKDLQVPDSIQVVTIYLSQQDIQIKTVSVNRIGRNYTFPFNIPDSTSTLIFCITNEKPLNKFDFSVETNNIIDNNNGLGFIILLYNKEGKRFDFENIDKATLLYHFAPHYLKLKEISKAQLINWYENTYQKYPDLKKKNDFDYHYYLDLLYKANGDAVKHKLLAYAKQMEGMKKNENKWIWAAKTYSILGLRNEQSRVEKDIIAAYPTGYKAKEDFWRKFNSSEKLSTSSILSTMNDYVSRFNDTSYSSKDKFYIQIISLYLNKKMWDSLLLYQPLITNKIYLSNIYNNFASRLCHGQLDTSGNNLNIAKTLSQRAMNYTKYRIANPVADDYSNVELQTLYNRFADSYAQILYKLGQYDSAFYYQDAIYRQANQLDEGGIERYVLYSEKVKGINYTKQIIEAQLLKGTISDPLLEQLHSMYKKMGIDDSEFNSIKVKSFELALKKNIMEIETKFGTIKAKNFTLKNILGQSVSLSALKGKVVILDFWATWCTPCIAAFPMMKELVNKYKNDTGVAFLFVDILERTTPEKMQMNATKLIKEGNYNFNVLLDTTGELVTHYKIESIPMQVIIDETGNIVFIGNKTNNLAEIIEYEKNKST